MALWVSAYKVVAQTTSAKSLSQSSLLTSSVTSLSSQDSNMLSRVPKRVDSDDFRSGFGRKSSVRRHRSREKLMLESRKGLDKSSGSFVADKSLVQNPTKISKAPSNTTRSCNSRTNSTFKVDVATQVNFGSCTFSRSESPETRPVERAIEARSGSEDGLGSMVRCLHFAHTYIANRESFLFGRTSSTCHF